MITDWLMVIITSVYVIATILICRANIKSAEATKEQIAESKRQYEEEHRAYITYEIIFERRTWYGMRFTNHGKRVANRGRFVFNQNFLDSINKSKFYDTLCELGSKECTIGIGQSYDVYFGTDDFREIPDKEPIAGEIIYQDMHASYREIFEIDFEKYGHIFSVTTFADDLHEDMKAQTIQLKRIADILARMQSVLSPKDNVNPKSKNDNIS